MVSSVCEQCSNKLLSALVLILLVFPAFTMHTYAWSNGGYSSDPSQPDYGTHDWIAQHALDWLPLDEKAYLENNLAAYLYGTELPDNGLTSDGIGDTTKHHVYFFSDGTVQDDSSAMRASEEYDLALSYLEANEFVDAAKHVGIMAHYIVDLAVFGHVMGSGTEWGAEHHHSDYESYVNTRTNSYMDDFNSYLASPGSLDVVTAYDAALNLAYDTTFDPNSGFNCVWMDQNYDWNNLSFKDRCGESLNLAVIYLANVIHTLYLSARTLGDLTTVWRNAVLVHGTITPYGPLPWGALIEDTVGANSLLTALSSYGLPSVAFDVDVAEWVDQRFHWKQSTPTALIAVGGPAVNLVSYAYNPLLPFNLTVTEGYIELRVDWNGITYIRYQFVPKQYVLHYSNGTELHYAFEDHDFAIISVCFDSNSSKHVFFVMGMRADGTLGACRYLASTLDSFAIETATAEVLLLHWHDANGDGEANGEEMASVATYP
jgi:hypothetical protein